MIILIAVLAILATIGLSLVAWSHLLDYRQSKAYAIVRDDYVYSESTVTKDTWIDTKKEWSLTQ